MDELLGEDNSSASIRNLVPLQYKRIENVQTAQPETEIIYCLQPNSKFCDNRINTAKYTPFNFIPALCYIYFQSDLNVFFWALAILQHRGGSPTGKYHLFIPIFMIFILRMLKHLITDYQRHKFDRDINEKVYYTFSVSSMSFEDKKCKEICVGDLLMLKKDDIAPADMILAKSDHFDFKAYVSTMSLNGETQKCPKNVHKCFWDYQSDPDAINLVQYLDFKYIERKKPHKNFSQSVKFNNQDVANNQIILRGSKLILANFVYGVVYQTGQDTFQIRNLEKALVKTSNLIKSMNKIIIYFALTIFISAFFITAISDKSGSDHSIGFIYLQFFLIIQIIAPSSILGMPEFFRIVFTMMIEYNQMLQNKVCINNDLIVEVFGAIKTICADKTGTLTKNELKLTTLFAQGDQDYSIGTQCLPSQKPMCDNLKNILRCILICHDAELDPHHDPNDLKSADYILTTNADEQALINGVLYFSSRIIEQKNDHITILINNSDREKYRIIKPLSLPFNHENKFMIISCYFEQTNQYISFLKGSYEKVIELCIPNTFENSQSKIDKFHKQCHRTLAFAFKVYDSGQEPCVEDVTKLGSYVFIGASAISDELADDVPLTIYKMAQADINVWILTGDHSQVAENIAMKINLINVNFDTIHRTFNLSNEEISDLLTHKMTNKDVIIFDQSTIWHVLENPRAAMASLLNAKSVIISRCSPHQKAQFVYINQKYGRRTTLAIGDGANDVTMLQKANVSVGIHGVEGSEAANSADATIQSFKYLQYLIFVQGSRYLARFQLLLQFFIYKSFIIALCALFFVFSIGIRPMIVYDKTSMILINTLFFMIPMIALAFFSNENGTAVLLRNPTLYKISLYKDRYFLGSIFVWILNAIAHSIIIYYFLYSAFKYNSIMNRSGDLLDKINFGGILMLSIICVTIIRASLEFYTCNLIAIALLLWTVVSYLIFLRLYSYLINDDTFASNFSPPALVLLIIVGFVSNFGDILLKACGDLSRKKYSVDYPLKSQQISSCDEIDKI